MANMQGFDANTVDRDNTIPEAEYEAVITGSEDVPTKDSTGQYFKFEFTVCSGEFDGRKIWHNFNMVNKNPEAIRIGRAQLADACLAVGIPSPKDTSELHNIPLLITVKKKESDGFGIQNVITKFKAKGGSAPAAGGSTSATTSNTPPWKK